MPDDVLRPGIRAAGAETTHPVFYLDLAAPECYLVAERILAVVPVPVQWVPVHLSPEPLRGPEREAVTAVAEARGIQPVRWPPAFDAELANLTATYAASIGRAVAFVQAALRQAYAGARDLSVSENVLIAASACEMHPSAVLKAVGTRGTRRTLDQATATARARGVTGTPAIWIPSEPGDARVLHGDRRLDEAAALLNAG